MGKTGRFIMQALPIVSLFLLLETAIVMTDLLTGNEKWFFSGLNFILMLWMPMLTILPPGCKEK